MTTNRPRRMVKGRDVKVGDVIDYGKGWHIVSIDPMDSPLGAGRIGYNPEGAGFALFDEHPVRLLTFGDPL